LAASRTARTGNPASTKSSDQNQNSTRTPKLPNLHQNLHKKSQFFLLRKTTMGKQEDWSHDYQAIERTSGVCGELRWSEEGRKRKGQAASGVGVVSSLQCGSFRTRAARCAATFLDGPNWGSNSRSESDRFFDPFFPPFPACFRGRFFVGQGVGDLVYCRKRRLPSLFFMAKFRQIAKLKCDFGSFQIARNEGIKNSKNRQIFMFGFHPITRNIKRWLKFCASLWRDCAK
jgi:hypothetical protein